MCIFYVSGKNNYTANDFFSILAHTTTLTPVWMGHNRKYCTLFRGEQLTFKCEDFIPARIQITPFDIGL